MALVRAAGIAFLPASPKATPLLLDWLIDWVWSSDPRTPSRTNFMDLAGLASLAYIVDEHCQLMRSFFPRAPRRSFEIATARGRPPSPRKRR